MPLSHLSVVFAILLCLAASPASADDLTLKDGHKISGNIVGFENGMFRVETAYGFVLVRKDKVASVKMTESGAKEDTSGQGGDNARGEPSGGPASNQGDGSPLDATQPARRRDSQYGNSSNTGPGPAPERTSIRTDSPPHAERASPPPSLPPYPPVVVSRPLDEPSPIHIIEHVEGNIYVNDSFHFAMYKPPDWKVYGELPRGKVSAIVAIASEDEQTLLFVDRQAWSGTPDLNNDSVEANLRRAYQNYKMISESQTQIDGRPALRRYFTGVMDGADWHGVAVRVAQGAAVFGIIGMTSAETFQFQEAIFNKILKSFHFLTATSEVNPATPASGTP